jgi:RNase H-fold protein (predicted Holliday junction resolvase)
MILDNPRPARGSGGRQAADGPRRRDQDDRPRLSDTRRIIAAAREPSGAAGSGRMARLFALIDTHSVGGLAVGLPLTLAGIDGPRTQSVRQFARNLTQRCATAPVAFNERQRPRSREMIAADYPRAAAKSRDRAPPPSCRLPRTISPKTPDPAAGPNYNFIRRPVAACANQQGFSFGRIASAVAIGARPRPSVYPRSSPTSVPAIRTDLSHMKVAISRTSGQERRGPYDAEFLMPTGCQRSDPEARAALMSCTAGGSNGWCCSIECASDARRIRITKRRGVSRAMSDRIAEKDLACRLRRDLSTRPPSSFRLWHLPALLTKRTLMREIRGGVDRQDAGDRGTPRRHASI